jgi:hypothetical protein
MSSKQKYTANKKYRNDGPKQQQQIIVKKAASDISD